MVFNVCSLQLIFFQMEFWEDLMLKWGVNVWLERGRAVVVAGRFFNYVCLEISSYCMYIYMCVYICIYVYMCVCYRKIWLLYISILMLPTSLFDPIHVSFFALITVELPQSMSTVRFSRISLIMSNLANTKITIPFTPSGTIRSMCQLLSSKLCLLSHHLVKA